MEISSIEYWKIDNLDVLEKRKTQKIKQSHDELKHDPIHFIVAKKEQNIMVYSFISEIYIACSKSHAKYFGITDFFYEAGAFPLFFLLPHYYS